MILLNNINWFAFKKIIRLCDNDSDMCMWESTSLSLVGVGNGRFMYNSEIDIEYDDSIFAYHRVDGVIEWNLSGDIIDGDDDDDDPMTNEFIIWHGMLRDLINKISMMGDNCDILTHNEIQTLVSMTEQLTDQMDNTIGDDE